MLQITQLTSNAKQNQNLILQDGTSIFIEIEYKPQQLGWFITNLAYRSFSVQNIRITTSPNMLRQFKNQIPFGMACFTVANQDPTLQEDFSSNRSQLYILTADEVAAYEAYLNGD